MLAWNVNSPLRVSAVSFLNTVPLVYGLEPPSADLSPDYILFYRLPAACAEDLLHGRADVGLVPAVELVRQPLTLIGDVGIGSDGPVRSILLVSKVPIVAIRTLATDTSSRTSVALAATVLRERYGARPRLLPHAPELEPMLEAADAALLIGDPALRLEPDRLPYTVLDLGAEWRALTGLPMVYAVWAARPGVPTEGLRELFRRGYEEGRAHLEEIAQREAANRNFPVAPVREYLTRHIKYPLGNAEREGLARFLEYAREFENLTKQETVA